MSQAVNEKLNEELARIKTVQMLSDLGSVWMAVIAPHRKLEVEFHTASRYAHLPGRRLPPYRPHPHRSSIEGKQMLLAPLTSWRSTRTARAC